MRTPTGKDTRDKQLTAYLTEYQRNKLDEVARATGFKSRSEFVSAVLEALIVGSFTPRAGSDLCTILDKLTRNHADPLKYEPQLFAPEPIIERKAGTIKTTKRKKK